MLNARRIATLVWLVVGALGVTWSGWSQESAPAAATFLESLEVRLVNVGVVVTDKNGEPITDLKVSDFVLKEDGRKVKVSHFGVPGAVSTSGAGSVEQGSKAETNSASVNAPELGSGGYVMLLVDNLAVRAQSRKMVLDAARRYLDENADSRTLYAVASYDGFLRMRQTFTKDRTLLNRALEDLGRLNPLGMARQSERWAQTRDNLETLRSILDLVNDPARADDVPRHLGTLTSSINAYASRVNFETSTTLYAASHLVNALGSLPGRKALVFVSEGMPMRAGEEFYQAAQDVALALPSQTGAVNSESSIALRSAQLGALSDSAGTRRTGKGKDKGAGPPGLQQLTALANANRVSFYTLKSEGYAGGVPAEFAGSVARLYTPQLQRIRDQNLGDTLAFMASNTGGRARVGGDIGALMKGAERDLSQSYSLAFAPSRSADGQFHELQVKVKRKGAKVRFRHGYVDKTVGDRLADRATTSLLLGIDDNPHGISIEVESVAESAKQDVVQVVLVVQIPLRSLPLVEKDGVFGVDTQLFIAARDTRGAAAPVQGLGLRIEVDRSLEEDPDQVFTGRLPLELRSGSQRVALAFVDPQSGSASFVSLDLEASP